MLTCRHCHRALHTQPQIPTGQVLGESYVLLPTSNSPSAIQQQQQLFASQASSMLLSEEYAMGSFIGDALGGASFDTPGEGRGHVMVPDRRVEEQYFGHEPPRQTKANQRHQNSRSSSPSQGGGNLRRQPLGYGDNHTVEPLGESMSAVATHADLSHHVQLITTQNAHCAGMTVTTPACKECVDSMIEQIDRQAERARYDKRCFAGFLQSTGTSVRNEEVNQIEQRIQFYEEELAALEENLQLMQKEREEIREQQQALESEGAVLVQEEMMMWNELNDLQLQEETFHDLRDLAKARIDGIEGTISSVQQLNVLHDMFSISQSGPFATINNFRVGQLPSVPVEWNEINAGFGECALLLNTLAGIVGLEFSDFKIVPLGSFSKIVRFTNLRMEYSLHGSDQDNFSESHFNLGLGAWITCLRQLIVFVEASDPTMRLPYKISKHAIKSYSILYLKNKQAEWTKALKYALTNLKWLLIWVGARGVPKRT
uniref:Atg6 BARA domain-containing protein n=1 Tax=Globisporangium ultimum (strain ATCC 200006 / CBS 805.95 / DAOM BR144) TaxID=431595 RepID=K3WII1_GLOUD